METNIEENALLHVQDDPGQTPRTVWASDATVAELYEARALAWRYFFEAKAGPRHPMTGQRMKPDRAEIDGWRRMAEIFGIELAARGQDPKDKAYKAGNRPVVTL